MKDNVINIQSSKNILLTGAGFTKNFGGFEIHPEFIKNRGIFIIKWRPNL